MSGIRRKIRIGLAAAGLLALAPLLPDAYISLTTEVHRDAHLVPHAPVALVLGTARQLRGGQINLFYRARLEAARDLFEAGAVRAILVSGDNGTVEYDEPGAMRRDLIALGVPESVITTDHAGFRTLDSVVRARKVFGLNQVTIVSQPFHAERAVYLARHAGLDAVAFGASNPGRGVWLKVRIREVLARNRAVLDVAVGTEPRFLGDREPVNGLALEPPR